MHNVEMVEQPYLKIAIQTVLYLKRRQIRQYAEQDQNCVLIREMSVDIAELTQKFKQIADEIVANEQGDERTKD